MRTRRVLRRLTQFQQPLPRGWQTWCAWCREQRCVDGVWQPCTVAAFEQARPTASHGLCPSCAAIERAKLAHRLVEPGEGL